MSFHEVFTFKFFLEVARPSLRKKKMLSCLTFLVLLLDFVFAIYYQQLGKEFITFHVTIKRSSAHTFLINEQKFDLKHD